MLGESFVEPLRVYPREVRVQLLNGRKPACDSALIELTGKLQYNGQGAAGSHQGYCVFQTAIDSRVFEHERRVNHLDRLQIDDLLSQVHAM